MNNVCKNMVLKKITDNIEIARDGNYFGISISLKDRGTGYYPKYKEEYKFESEKHFIESSKEKIIKMLECYFEEKKDKKPLNQFLKYYEKLKNT